MTENPDIKTCGICAGTGISKVYSQCSHCLGSGTLTFDRAVELCEREWRRARNLNKRNEDHYAEIQRLRGLLESQSGGDPSAWAKQRTLMNKVNGQRNSIEHMARRIAELGGGNYPVEVADDARV